MASYQDFINSLLPGNYALTKSMELTKIQSSGTLWYTKKFLVLYYYIFLSNDIFTREYVDKVTEHFDRYISALDPEVQKSAKLFFYPNNDAINFKSDTFKTFSSFASYTDFKTRKERTAYYLKAKKIYFALLMNSGGQTGVKKLMKEAIQEVNFSYSSQSVKSVLQAAAVQSAIADANSIHKIKDNSIKYILSPSAMKSIIDLSYTRKVTVDDANYLISKYPRKAPRYRAIENDMVSFIRNERKLLYYYGYFHSKSSGAKDLEFSSLTPIGELALTANAIEFLALWEHQKIKMISQPETVDINNISVSCNNAERFSISYTPYTDILGHLIRHGSLSFNEYKYIVSRKNHSMSDSDWVNIEDEILGHVDDIKNFVNGFGRKGDVTNEDIRKELLKYLLGIRSDLSFDGNKNFLNILSFNDRTVSCNNSEDLSFLYGIYTKLNDYKILKYRSLYDRCEKDLRKRYIESCNKISSKMDAKVKIDWDLYNIHLDKFIYLGVIISIAAINLGLVQLEKIDKKSINDLSEYCSEHFASILKNMGLRNGFAVRKEILKVINAIRDADYTVFLETDESPKEQVIARYRTSSAEDLFSRIQNISGQANVVYSEERRRNSTLVSLLKSYYMRCYSENMTLKCECCGEETFITESGEPYVEFHHLIPFNIAYGPDHYLNLFALCPSCHRKIHFLKLEEKHNYYVLLNHNNFFQLPFIDRLQNLKEQHLLRSYHLEYLLADNAITQDEYNSIAA